MDPITMGLLGLCIYVWTRPQEERFRYLHKDGSWRAYFCGEPPNYEHVLHDEDGFYVCWDEPLPTRDQAVRVARHWESTFQ